MDDLHTRFLQVHMKNQRHVFSYILAAVRDFHVAEDLLQEATLVLWKKFGQYREDAPYLPWAFGVVRRLVARHFHEKGRREAVLPVEVIESVVRTNQAEEEHLSLERGALRACVERLPKDQRELVKLRYESSRSLRDLAEWLGKSAAAVNMMLVRVRRALLDCTRRAVTAEVR